MRHDATALLDWWEWRRSAADESPWETGSQWTRRQAPADAVRLTDTTTTYTQTRKAFVDHTRLGWTTDKDIAVIAAATNDGEWPLIAATDGGSQQRS